MADIELPFTDDYKQGAMARRLNSAHPPMANRPKDWQDGWIDAEADAAVNGNSIRTAKCLAEGKRVDPFLIFAGATASYKLGAVLPNGMIVVGGRDGIKPMQFGTAWIARNDLAEAEAHGWLRMADHEDLVQVMREPTNA